MANDFHLKIDGIDGESGHADHKGEIEIVSFSFGVSNPTSAGKIGSGSGAGKPTFQAISFTAYTSKASPGLMAACAQLSHKAKAVLTGRKSGEGQKDYFLIKLENVAVSSYNVTASGDVPMDIFTLSYDKVTIEYKPQDSKGSTGGAVTAGFDISATKKI
jgi:type VI secretion system secreted protein Hcp